MRTSMLRLATAVGLSFLCSLTHAQSSDKPWTVIRSSDFGPASEGQNAIQVVTPPQAASSDMITQLNELSSDAYPELARQYLESARWNERRGATAEMLSNLQAAANYGSAGAHYELAKLYQAGEKVERNLGLVSTHLYAAAGLGNAEAERVLGLAMLQGSLGVTDPAEGEARLIKAAETSIRAKRELGMWLAGQIDGVPKNARQGQQYLQAAADLGDEQAAIQLGKIDPALLVEPEALPEPAATEQAGDAGGLIYGEPEPEALTAFQPGARIDLAKPRSMPTADELFAEANTIMLKPQGQRSIEDEARAYAMFSLAFELGSDLAGKELNYLDGVRAIKAKEDPQWLFNYKQKVIAELIGE